MDQATPSLSDSTAKIEAGINGLWEMGQKMTKLVCGYKLLQSLNEQGIATGEIDSIVESRRQQRDRITGK